jgi:hypothetical protein
MALAPWIPPTAEQDAEWRRRRTPQMYRIVPGAVSQARRLAVAEGREITSSTCLVLAALIVQYESVQVG